MRRQWSWLYGALSGFGLAAGLALAQAAVEGVEDDVPRLYRLEESSPCWHEPTVPDAQVDDLLAEVTRRHGVRALIAIMRSMPPNTAVTMFNMAPRAYIVGFPAGDGPVSRWLVLHESAHVILDHVAGVRGHGPEFRALLARLVEEYVDAACAADFRRRLADPRS